MTSEQARAQRVEQLRVFMEEAEARDAAGLPMHEYPVPSVEFTRHFDSHDPNVFDFLRRICESHKKSGTQFVMRMIGKDNL